MMDFMNLISFKKSPIFEKGWGGVQGTMAPVDTKARDAASRELDAHHDEMVPPFPRIYVPAAAPFWCWFFVSWCINLIPAVVWLAGLQLSALREHAAGPAAQGAPPELRPLQGIPVRTQSSPFSGTVCIQCHPGNDEGPILSAHRTRDSAVLCSLSAWCPLSFVRCFGRQHPRRFSPRPARCHWRVRLFL